MSIVIHKYNKEVLTGEDIHIVLSSRGGRNTVWERIDKENEVYVEVGTWKDNGRLSPLRKRFENYKNPKVWLKCQDVGRISRDEELENEED